jgi:hypothetical protein
MPVQLNAPSSHGGGGGGGSSTDGADILSVTSTRLSEKGRRMRAILEPPVLVDCCGLGPLLHKIIAIAKEVTMVRSLLMLMLYCLPD